MKTVSAVHDRGERLSLQNRRRLSLTLVLALSAPFSHLAAAAPVTLPANIPTPGQVQSNLPTAPLPPQPRSSLPLTSTPPPTANAIPPGGPTVTVDKFVITGNSVFPDAVLQPELAMYLGKPLTLAELYTAADALTKYYQSRGYGLARATVPEQQLTNGSVTLQVVEGHIGKVGFEGTGRTHEAVLRRQGSALVTGDVYTDKAMDRAVLLINDLPGVQAQAVLEPGSEFGTADLTYKVLEDPEFSGQLSIDDYGRKDVGRWRFNAEFDAASLSGIGDKLIANVTHTEGNLLNFGGLTYSLPLGPPGGRITADYNQTEYRVSSAQFSALKVRGDSKNGGLSYLFPEERSRLENFYWGVGFQHESSNSEASGKPVSGSSINFLQLTSYYNITKENGTNAGLSGTFSTDGSKNFGNDSSAERARLELDGNYATPFAADANGSNRWTFIARATGEWSPDPLNDTDKYSLGGPDNVRGFLSAEVRGDSGLFASFEVQRNLAPDLPFTLGAYFDGGKVWEKKFDTPPAAGCIKTKTNPCTTATTPGLAVTLSSVGTEMTFQSSDKRWQSRIEWAYPVGGYKPSDGDEGGRLWVTFGMNF